MFGARMSCGSGETKRVGSRSWSVRIATSVSKYTGFEQYAGCWLRTVAKLEVALVALVALDVTAALRMARRCRRREPCSRH